MVRKRSGVTVCTMWPAARTSPITISKVRTTPLTCGVQASLTSAILTRGPPGRWARRCCGGRPCARPRRVRAWRRAGAGAPADILGRVLDAMLEVRGQRPIGVAETAARQIEVVVDAQREGISLV